MEWFIPEPTVPVRQGDVLYRWDIKNGEIKEIFIVITADCDINKMKFGNQLACLRVIFLDDYIKRIWADKKLKKITADTEEKIHAQVAKWHRISIGKESGLSIPAVTNWALRDDPEKVCDALKIPQADRKSITQSLSSFRAASASLNDETAHSLAKYISFSAIIKGKDMVTTQSEIILQAKNEKLPDDTFLLTTLPQIQCNGAVVLLRELTGIDYRNIFCRPSDANSEESYIRVGRLDFTFKYAISQAFGSLYSRIGMPSDYEVRCKNVIENINKIEW